MSLKVEGVSKSFSGKAVLGDVSFTLGDNEVVGLIGPSGCGKTTLVKIILGLVEPSGGSILIDGRRADAATIRAKASYVPQQDSFYQFMTVKENLDYFASLYNTTSPVKPETFGLDADALAGDLSGGQRKRLSILCALSHRPKFLFLDEPTVGLDPISKKQIVELIGKLKKLASVVMVTHHLNEVEEICDRVVVLGRGVLLAEATPRQLMKETRSKNLEEAFVELVRKQ